MPTLECSRQINADVKTVYNLARRVEEFPDYMPDVRSIKVLESSPDGSRTLTDWVALVEKFNQTVHWVEEDIWDDVQLTCTFKQVTGDYKQFYGQWRFVSAGDGTVFESTVYYEYNIPLIGPLIQGLIAHLMKLNLENTLAAIGQRAEAKIPVASGMETPATKE